MNRVPSLLCVDIETGKTEIAGLFRECLKDFRIDVCPSAEEALTDPSLSEYSVIVSEYALPGMNGIAFLREIRNRFGNIPFGFLTGSGNEEIAIRALDEKADFYVRKEPDLPAAILRLAGKVRQVVSGRTAGNVIELEESKFRELAGFIPQMAFETDTHLRITYANPAALARFGYSHDDDVQGIDVLSLIHPSGHELMRENVNRIIRKESFEPHEYTALTRDGRAFPVIIDSAPIYIDGRISGFRGIVMDITTQKKLEQTIRENEEKFRTLVDHSQDGILILDPTGTILFGNRAAAKIIGIEDPGPVVRSRNVIEFISPSSRDAVMRDFANVAGGTDGYLARYRILTLTGEERCVESIGKTILFQNNPAILISLRDVTDRQQYEERLKKTTTDLEQIIRNMINGFVIWESVFDTEGKCISFRFGFFNDAYARISGLNCEDVKGKDVLEIWPDTEQNWIEVFGRVAITGMPEVFDMYHGPTRGWYHCNAYRPNNSPEKICVMFEDITEQRQNEDALRMANKKLNLLSGITRHDINNQLTTLNGYIDVLSQSTSDPAVMKYAPGITDVITRITDMIRFTREYELIGVNAPLWQDVQVLVNGAKERGIPKKIHYLNEIPMHLEIFADPLITKVFFNLVDNAIRHGGPVSMIRFYGTNEGTSLKIICEDNGGGIPDDEKELIFSRKFGKNTGYGLYIAREILDITGLSINETGIYGTGARFEISVPEGSWRYRKTKRRQNNRPPS